MEATFEVGRGKVLVLGLGNAILSDDAIGLNVVREVQRRLETVVGIDVRGTEEMGLALLDHVVGYRSLVLVDAVQTRQAPPGSIHEIEVSELKRLPLASPHFLGVAESLALGRVLGLQMPEQVRIFAVEVEDPFTVGTEMTPALRKALPEVVDRVCRAAKGLL